MTPKDLGPPKIHFSFRENKNIIELTILLHIYVKKVYVSLNKTFKFCV